jgi:hypothetical protein
VGFFPLLNYLSAPPAAPPGLPPSRPITRRKFARDEDDLLRSLDTQFGESSWDTVARHMGIRTARQCRDRWKHYVSPELVNDPWSESDDQVLLARYGEFGPQWARIAKFFPGRTDITVKNRYISIQGRISRELQAAQKQGARAAQNQDSRP